MNHFMLDIETLGAGPDAALVAFGVVPFDLDNGTMGGGILRTINLSDENIGVLDGDTVKWWMEQSNEAKKATFRPNGLSMKSALEDLLRWMNERHSPVNPGRDCPARLWSKGPQFDERILKAAFTRCGLVWPFHHSAGRDCRTVMELAAKLGITPKARPATLVEHNALHDALWQTEALLQVWRPLAARNKLDEFHKGSAHGQKLVCDIVQRTIKGKCAGPLDDPELEKVRQLVLNRGVRPASVCRFFFHVRRAGDVFTCHVTPGNYASYGETLDIALSVMKHHIEMEQVRDLNFYKKLYDIPTRARVEQLIVEWAMSMQPSIPWKAGFEGYIL